MKIIISETQYRNLFEYSYMGKFEGDSIKIGEFRRLKMPKPVLSNILKSISQKIGQVTTSKKLKNGEYDQVEINIFGQLFAFLTGRY